MAHPRKDSLLAIVDRRVLTALSNALAPQGWTVLTASGLDAALQIVRSMRPSLVIVDVARIRENAYCLAREIRLATAGDTKPLVLVLTGPLSASERALFRRWASVDEFLSYPFGAEDVVERARQMLQGKKAVRRPA